MFHGNHHSIKDIKWAQALPTSKAIDTGDHECTHMCPYVRVCIDTQREIKLGNRET